ncbi:MAG: DUF6064 family protein [Pseudomonadota bacterium]
MAEWSSYSLHDLLLFSPQAYTGLFELLNTTLWPLHLVTLVLALAAAVLVLKGHRARHRLFWAVLSILWLWTGWQFLHVQYAAINWAAEYVAPAFWLQGLLFGLFAVVPKCPRISYAGTVTDRMAAALYVFAVIGYPIATLALGRSFDSVEFLGISADPGVVATLAVLVLSRARFIWLSWVVPLAWCALTGVTLWLLESPEFLIAPLAAMLAVVAAVASGTRPHTLTSK